MDITEQLVHSLQEKSGSEPSVAVLGDLGYDYIYNSGALEAGKEVPIRDFTRTIAGAGGYFACGIARLGATVYFLTELGDDADGCELLAEIGRRGVQTGGIRVLADTRSYFTLIFADEEERFPRQVATYLGPLGRMSVSDLEVERYSERAQLLYSCNYFQLLRVRTEIGKVFSSLRDRGTLTAYDANAGDGWENPDALEILKHDIYPHTDIVFLNQSEARYLTGQTDPLEAVSKASPDSKLVVVKCGPSGVVLRHDDRVWQCPAFPLSQAVRDTVGAGDSFQAAFLYFHLSGLPVLHCAILGCANAAATVHHPGGVTGQRNRRELAEMLKHYRVCVVGEDTVEIEALDC